MIDERILELQNLLLTESGKAKLTEAFVIAFNKRKCNTVNVRCVRQLTGILGDHNTALLMDVLADAGGQVQ